MTRKFLPFLLVLAVLQAGCAASVAKFESPSLAAHEKGSTTTVRSLGFLWGLVPPAKISLDQCGTAGLQQMKVRQGFIDWIITTATAGIVISYKVKMTCAEPVAPAAPVPPVPEALTPPMASQVSPNP